MGEIKVHYFYNLIIIVGNIQHRGGWYSARDLFGRGGDVVSGPLPPMCLLFQQWSLAAHMMASFRLLRPFFLQCLLAAHVMAVFVYCADTPLILDARPANSMAFIICQHCIPATMILMNRCGRLTEDVTQ